MKRTLDIIAVLLLAGPLSFAQTGVFDVHPASNPSGRILTQEEATMGRVRVQSVQARWTPEGNVVWRDASGKNLQLDPVKGVVSDYVQAQMQPVTRQPRTGAYSDKGSLMYRKADGSTVTVMQGGNGIVCGETVSRSEFGISGGIFPAPDGNLVAFYRKDETKVTDFPLLDITTRTGSLMNIKYPMNGMTSENITLWVYNPLNGGLTCMDVTDFDDERYLTNISWSPDSKYIFIQVLNRAQHEMHLNMYRADDGRFVRTILTEQNDAWVEPENPLQFIKGGYEFLYRIDNRDGYKNLYLCDTLGTVRRLSNADADVSYVGNDGTYVYYTSAEVSPVENHLFRVKLTMPKANAKKPADRVAKAKISPAERLTPDRGWHRISFSVDMKYFIDSYSSFNVPSVAQVRSVNGGKLVKELGAAPDPLADFAQCEVDFGTVKSADGKFDNYYRLYKPLGFDPAKKYPVVVYVYGGPHSQLVQDTWLGSVRMWEMLMAQKGYVVYVQDNRGTPNRGAEFEKAINRQCGQAEMADQMVGVRMLMEQPWVDSSRIGVHGWSYGGFMTISLVTNYPDVFKVGVAGGPVIDWKWYEVMYGERYMDNPETNPEGFAKTSLINKAPDLKSKLLICQGAIDDTVVWQHSLSFVQTCIEHNIPVDYFPYPRSQHNVSGVWRVHLMDKITDYFDSWL